MTIYRNVLKEIDYDLKHREEVMEKNNWSLVEYYAYMTGRLAAINNWLLNENTVTIAD